MRLASVWQAYGKRRYSRRYNRPPPTTRSEPDEHQIERHGKRHHQPPVHAASSRETEGREGQIDRLRGQRRRKQGLKKPHHLFTSDVAAGPPVDTVFERSR